MSFGGIAEKPESAAVVIDYSDLSGHRYGSQIQVEGTYFSVDDSQPLVMARVRHTQGEIVVGWNDPRNYATYGLLNQLRVRLGGEPRYKKTED